MSEFNISNAKIAGDIVSFKIDSLELAITDLKNGTFDVGILIPNSPSPVCALESSDYYRELYSAACEAARTPEPQLIAPAKIFDRYHALLNLDTYLNTANEALDVDAFEIGQAEELAGYYAVSSVSAASEFITCELAELQEAAKDTVNDWNALKIYADLALLEPNEIDNLYNLIQALGSNYDIVPSAHSGVFSVTSNVCVDIQNATYFVFGEECTESIEIDLNSAGFKRG